MQAHLTVTGTYRSGTTLVERLIDQHPEVSIASQPLPLLWVAAKRAFLTSRGRSDRLALGTLFRDHDHVVGGLSAFLATWPTIGRDVLQRVLAEQAGYSGAMSTDVSRLPIDEAPNGAYLPLVEWYHRELARVRGFVDVALVGAKEILVEEFIGSLLDAGNRVVVVLRDPRAVVASTIAGRGVEFAGSPRPTLFSVRAWRRSVDLALAHVSHPRCRVLRYEDVLSDPERVTAELHGWMGVPPLDGLPEILLDQHGAKWRPNTSFERAAKTGTADLARARRVLDERTWRYIETTTLPERLALGYPSTGPHNPERDLSGFVEPVPIERDDIPQDLSSMPAAIAEERRRLELVREDVDDITAREWFLHPEAHRWLRAALTDSASIDW